MSSEKILVTGGTGYIGKSLHAEADESTVICNLGRRENPPYRWRLGETPGNEAFDGATALIHCAYDMGLTREAEIFEVNVEGTRKLYEAASAAGVKRFIAVSSIAAFDGCRSVYGRAKIAIETITRDYDGTVVRPGTVYGEEGAGVYGAMENWVKSLPVVPVLSPSPDLYMCHVQDLCHLLLELAGSGDPLDVTITAASSQPTSLKSLILTLQRRHGIQKPLFPVPWRLPWLACKAFEIAGLKPPFRSDGLVGLMKGNPSPDFSSPRDFQTEFRAFRESQSSD